MCIIHDFEAHFCPLFLEVFSQRPEKGHELHDFSPAKPGESGGRRCGSGAKHMRMFMVSLLDFRCILMGFLPKRI